MDPDEEEDDEDELGFGSAAKKEEDDDPVMRKRSFMMKQLNLPFQSNLSTKPTLGTPKSGVVQMWLVFVGFSIKICIRLSLAVIVRWLLFRGLTIFQFIL